MTTCLGKSCSSGYCACLSWAFVIFCVCPSFPFGIEGRMWVVIVLIPNHCLSIFFDSPGISTENTQRGKHDDYSFKNTVA